MKVSRLWPLLSLILVLGCAAPTRAQTVKADFGAYSAKSGVAISQNGSQLRARWPLDAGETGVLTLDLAPDAPLFSEMSIAKSARGRATPILTSLDPQLLLTVGTRDLKNPAGWVAFFDYPNKRPHQTHLAKIAKTSARVESDGKRTTIAIGGLTAGPFAGELRVSLYPGSRLIHVESVVSTQRDASAILYDAGLSSANPSWNRVSFLDNRDRWQSAAANADAQAVSARFRAVMAQSAGGSVAVFPAPHAYFYPLDRADNFGFAWHGRGFRDVAQSGFGIRQPLDGDNRHVPWINAPPGTQQKLGAFYLLSSGDAPTTLEQVKRYTNGDSFPKLPGYKTFSSHYHVEHTIDYLKQQSAQKVSGIPAGLENPEFVQSFKRHGVDIVHLAEFHLGVTPALRASRLENFKLMHQECARLSGPDFLMLPGEEPNVHLGGHWLSFFPRPVYWTLERAADQPFKEEVAGIGTVYHVGNAADMVRLMDAEDGLMWTAHPRIKGSIGFPDRYWNEPFFRGDRFLGGAWKAMPADLSKPQLGTRVLDLEDDMANAGMRKYIPGEVDVFDFNNQSELYAHLNINYLKIGAVPRFEDGWGSVTNALRNGQFFVSTGEILIPQFSLGGRESGETLRVTNGATRLQTSLRWTFPLRFAEVVSGDGAKVYRQRVNLSETTAFGQRNLRLDIDLSKRRWARLEVWDIAGNGAFTQPVWIESNAMPPLVTQLPPVPKAATFGRFVPERSDDFAWENDLIAFRAFGPALRASGENSGIDVWLKRVSFPIVDKWYDGEQKGISYHEDNGEGLDAYDVGSSRGCGGNGIWKNGKLYISNVFKSWKIISNDGQKTVFDLEYDYDVDGETIHETKRISIALGQRLFESHSTFTRDGAPVELEIGIGVTTHGGKAAATLDAKNGWMSCWESVGGAGLGTGVALNPRDVIEMREIESANSNLAHALAIARTDARGQVKWWSGYGWEKAGAITTRAQWADYLAQFARGLK